MNKGPPDQPTSPAINKVKLLLDFCNINPFFLFLNPFFTGETVTLVKDTSIYSGNYHLSLIITDAAGYSSNQNLQVTVRHCLRDGKSYKTQVGPPGISVIFLCILLMLCKYKFQLLLSFLLHLTSKHLDLY